MTNNRYLVNKTNRWNTIASLDYTKLLGYDVTPKNTRNYGGIIVNKLVIIKRSFIERILKKKIQRKLELYLKFLLDFIASDGEDGGALSEVLNDVTRYRDILNYRYRKYLGDKYIDLLLKKIDILEYELKVKQYNIMENTNEETIGSKSR